MSEIIPSIDLGKLSSVHRVKVGDVAEALPTLLSHDCLLTEDGAVVGAYIASVATLDPLAAKLLKVVNAQFLTKAVPKSMMTRSGGITEAYKTGHSRREAVGMVQQFSTILGGVPPKPHMRRSYKTASSVHAKPSAKAFIRATAALARQTELIIQKISPELFAAHCKATEGVYEEWRFGGTGWTSMIANANIAARYHMDGANIRNSFNAIYTKRYGMQGGSICVPDYGVTIEQGDESLLLYPAWRNMHGVTDLKPDFAGAYRNSFVLYPLKAFNDGPS